MWKGIKNRSFINVYETVEISALNLERLLTALKKGGVEVKNVKKFEKGNKKRAKITINQKQSEKFFAIATNLCYNVKKVKMGGFGYPVYYLINNIGICLGLLAFLFISIFTSNLVLGVDYSGTGAVYKRQVQDLLDKNGITIFSSFSGVDLKELSNKILIDNKSLSFCECSRVGNRLKINLAKAVNNNATLLGNVKALYSDVDGEIVDIIVYRGTKRVNPGDVVKNGQLLIDGEIFNGDKVLELNVIGSVKIKCEYVYSFIAGDNGEELAIAFLENELLGNEISDYVVEKIPDGEKFIYKVISHYVKILNVG